MIPGIERTDRGPDRQAARYAPPQFAILLPHERHKGESRMNPPTRDAVLSVIGLYSFCGRDGMETL
jgi:hypothetical protein